MNFGAGGRRKFKQPCKFAINGTKLQETLASENPLKMMKNGFYFTLKAVFVLKIFKLS